jgi:hypothetical protein
MGTSLDTKRCARGGSTEVARFPAGIVAAGAPVGFAVAAARQPPRLNFAALLLV